MVLARSEVGVPVVAEEISHAHLFKVTGLSSTNLEKLAKAPASAADFEEAITATGYGKFNLFLMMATLPAFWSAVSVTSSTSYIFAGAQCDMNLSMVDMGTINAITYGGAMSSAIIWGFLSDTLGRRSIMVWGYLATGLLEIMAAMSQNFAMLLVSRFASGFLFNGPMAVLISYLAELHRTELRARVILLSNLFYTFANTTLPLLAWGILTKHLDLYIFGEKFVLHSWNLFLLATALMPLLTSLGFFFLPESPKFLMSRGRNEEAMKVFKWIYRLNTGNSKEEYPVKALVEEKTEQLARGVAALRGGVTQLAPLFKVPHAPWLLLICIIHAGYMIGNNTLRLWYPQLAAMIWSGNGSLCSAIAPNSAPVVEETCQPIQTDMMTYLQSAIVGTGSILTYGVGGAIINRCGKKLVASFCCVISAATIVLMPLLGSNPFAVVAMVTCAMAFTALAGASMNSIAVELFPTSLRVMAMAIFLMMGRLGTITGTVAFPALLDYGCYPPFVTLAVMLTLCGCACFLVPNTTLKKLE